MNIIVTEISFIVRIVRPLKLPYTMLRAPSVPAYIGDAVSPFFGSLSVLLVILPLTSVDGSIVLRIHTMAMGLVPLPFPFIQIAIDVKIPTSSMCLVFTPLPLVTSSIWPHLKPMAISTMAQPFTCVGGPCFVVVGRLPLSLSWLGASL